MNEHMKGVWKYIYITIHRMGDGNENELCMNMEVNL